MEKTEIQRADHVEYVAHTSCRLGEPRLLRRSVARRRTLLGVKNGSSPDLPRVSSFISLQILARFKKKIDWLSAAIRGCQAANSACMFSAHGSEYYCSHGISGPWERVATLRTSRAS